MKRYVYAQARRQQERAAECYRTARLFHAQGLFASARMMQERAARIAAISRKDMNHA